MKFNVKFLVRQAVIASIYAVLTIAIGEFAYGPIQFRYSEVMTLLAFFNPQYVSGLTIGCLISNLFSPFGMLDVIVGTLCTLIVVIIMSKLKNIFIASIIPSLQAPVIGLMIYLMSGRTENFLLMSIKIFASEIIAVSFLGIMLFRFLLKNKYFVEVFDLDKSKVSYLNKFLTTNKKEI